jgi:hypothetical protein
MGAASRQIPITGSDAAAVKEMAREKLGRWRYSAGAELRAVPKILSPSERILTMAAAAAGMKGRLLVVTNRALFFIHKNAPLRPVHCTRYLYSEIVALQAVEKPLGTGLFVLEFTHGDEQLSWEVRPKIRGPEIAGIAGLATARGSGPP